MKILAISAAGIVIGALILISAFQLAKILFNEVKELIEEAWHSPEA